MPDAIETTNKTKFDAVMDVLRSRAASILDGTKVKEEIEDIEYFDCSVDLSVGFEQTEANRPTKLTYTITVNLGYEDSSGGE